VSEHEQHEAPAVAAEERAAETRWQRGVRYGHRTGLYLALALGIAALIFLILLIARNADQVDFDYVFGSAHTRLIWLIVISAIAGWALGIATAYLVRRRTRGPR
jgi:uncharacterized integral membrane protein